MDREYAEKQDLWAEISELWVNRKLRRRKLRLSVMAMISVLLLGGVYFFTAVIPPQEPLYLQIQGQSLEIESSVNNNSVSSVDRREDAIENTETISI
ncbi:MAG: hypothetical protein U9R29_09445 [Thermodesulfobacteriota bacterium]|nr:hypothetical protein [Thermodesulfobacteriota bacterium]